jgi:predicted nucleic acid-binding protein
MRASYLDSSAIVKLVVAEPESAALRLYLRRRRPLVSSALARTEVLRALQPAGQIALARGRVVLHRLDLIRISGSILDSAGTLEPPHVRSLDAIHLATAQAVGDDLGQLITYDDRMSDAARQLGLRAVSPA